MMGDAPEPWVYQNGRGRAWSHTSFSTKSLLFLEIQYIQTNLIEKKELFLFSFRLEVSSSPLPSTCYSKGQQNGYKALSVPCRKCYLHSIPLFSYWNIYTDQKKRKTGKGATLHLLTVASHRRQMHQFTQIADLTLSVYELRSMCALTVTVPMISNNFIESLPGF